MKKKNQAVPAPDEMRPHYEFDYRKSRPNRFADRPKLGCVRSAREEKSSSAPADNVADYFAGS